jgi:hypothetical protein
MTVSFGDLITDLKESRYFQVWCIMWAVVSIVFFIGFGNITNISTTSNVQGSTTYQAYRILEQNAEKTGLFFPAVQASTLSTNNSILSLTCNNDKNEAVTVYPSSTSWQQPAFTIQSQSQIATPSMPHIGCDVSLTKNGTGPDDGVSTVLRLAFSDTGTFSQAETVYIETDTIGTVYLSKTSYSGAITQSFYNPWYITHRLPSNQTALGGMQLFIEMNSFDVVNYQQYSTYTGWQAYADVGGMLMFAYVMHMVLMFVIGVFLNNDSRVLGGARASYDNVR